MTVAPSYCWGKRQRSAPASSPCLIVLFQELAALQEELDILVTRKEDYEVVSCASEKQNECRMRQKGS